MSDFDPDKRQKRPPVAAAGDDPWAKWRKPEAPTVPELKLPLKAAVDTEKQPKIDTLVATPVVRERPTGTLSPLKPVAVAKKPFKKPSTGAGAQIVRDQARGGSTTLSISRAPAIRSASASTARSPVLSPGSNGRSVSASATST